MANMDIPEVKRYIANRAKKGKTTMCSKNVGKFLYGIDLNSTEKSNKICRHCSKRLEEIKEENKKMEEENKKMEEEIIKN
jgi:hypothetical protein